jgi:hypothetical protein
MDDDNYKAAGGGGRKKGYDDEVNNFSVKGNSPIDTGIVREGRGCTDVCFLMVFLAFVGSMGYLTWLGNSKGNV